MKTNILSLKAIPLRGWLSFRPRRTTLAPKISAMAMFGCLAVVALLACASLPKVLDPSGIDLNVTALSDRMVMVYYGQGGPFSVDPYLPITGFMIGKQFSYVVLRIQLVSLRKSHISLIDARATDSDGKVVARLHSRQDFEALIRSQTADEQAIGRLDTKVDQTYFPDGGVETVPGERTYTAVLVADTTIHLPVPISVEISVDGEARNLQAQWVH